MKIILSLLALCLALAAPAAPTIKKFSDYAETTTLADTWILPVEVPGQSPPYDYFTLATLRTFLNDTGPNIVTFVNNVGIAETGSTVAAVNLTWTLSGSTPTSQSINQGIGAIPVGTLTATYSTPFSANKTFTLTVQNAQGTDTANSSVLFEQKRYWGTSLSTSLNDAGVLGLSSEFGTSITMATKTITSSVAYIYLAWPTAWGTPQITVNGLLNTAWTKTTRAFVNGSGYSSSYDIYRSDNLLTGTYQISVSP